MKIDPQLYIRDQMPRQEIYINLAKAAALLFSSIGLFFLGTEPYFGYLDDYYIIVTILAMGCAIWGATFFVRIGSGIFDRQLHK